MPGCSTRAWGCERDRNLLQWGGGCLKVPSNPNPNPNSHPNPNPLTLTPNPNPNPVPNSNPAATNEPLWVDSCYSRTCTSFDYEFRRFDYRVNPCNFRRRARGEYRGVPRERGGVENMDTCFSGRGGVNICVYIYIYIHIYIYRYIDIQIYIDIYRYR